MAIEFLCSGCSNTLRVPDEHAGKHARCPQCSSVNSIPSQSAPTPIQPTQPAGNLFDSVPPQQQPQQQAPVNPYADPVRTAGQPQGYAQPQPYQPARNQYYTAHRGGLILTLGIMALVCNIMLLPGILAWVLGSADLKQMKTGRMDPSGQGITTAGMVLGIIGTSFVILGILFYVVIFIIGISAAAAGGL